MKFLTIDYIKQHSRICTDADDSLLELYADSAEEMVLRHIRRSYRNVRETYGIMPKALMHAALMLVDLSYMQRSPISPTSISLVPYTFDMLIKPYMRLDGEEMPLDPTDFYLADYYGRAIITSDNYRIVTHKQYA